MNPGDALPKGQLVFSFLPSALYQFAGTPYHQRLCELFQT